MEIIDIENSKEEIQYEIHILHCKLEYQFNKSKELKKQLQASNKNNSELQVKDRSLIQIMQQ